MDKLSVTERRLKVLEYLVTNKQSTRYELSREFGVSVYTIGRDIIYLSSIAPVYTLQGNGGGVHILPNYKGYRIYLSCEEESLLCKLAEVADETDKKIIYGIIEKFSISYICKK